MAQDIRDMMKHDAEKGPKLNEGHEKRFADKLDAMHAKVESDGVMDIATTEVKSIPAGNHGISWLKVAAIIITLIAVSVFGYYSLNDTSELQTESVANTSEEKELLESPQLTLGSLSPDLKKVEAFYVTGINVQLASLEITDDNSDVIDGYMEQLSELDKEYTLLNTELNEVGPTESTITALVDNLKLRLELLFKLKNKLKELKIQNNEQFKSIQT